MPNEWDSWLQNSLHQWSGKGLLRTLHTTIPTGNSTVVLMGRHALDSWISDVRAGSRSLPAASPDHEDAGALVPLKLFSLNDYMGLSGHERVRQAASESAATYGMGPRSSAIVAGYSQEHRDLETALASLKHTEDCLLFPTGFAANMAAVSALCADSECAIFSDELNHASIIDGARLASRGDVGLHVYRHNDMAHLDQLLTACKKKRKLVVTDSLFSMDGDFADMTGIAALKKKHDFLWAVDEAHATLVCGETGAGAAEMYGVVDSVDLHIGTLSKAFGALGGFVATSRSMKSWLQNRGRSFVFSTSLPTPVVRAAHEALNVSLTEPWRREHLWSLVRRVGEGLGVTATSPIIPVIVGSEENALMAMSHFLECGMHVPAIRPPTVPQGTCRLRISLSAAHSMEDVDQLVEVAKGLSQKMQFMTLEQAQARTTQMPRAKL